MYEIEDFLKSFHNYSLQDNDFLLWHDGLCSHIFHHHDKVFLSVLLERQRGYDEFLVVEFLKENIQAVQANFLSVSTFEENMHFFKTMGGGVYILKDSFTDEPSNLTRFKSIDSAYERINAEQSEGE